MKKLLLIIFLMLFVGTTYSQVLRLRVFQYKVLFEPFDWTDKWLSSSSIFIMDVDKNIVKVFDDDFPQDLAINSLVEDKIVEDGENRIFNVVDKDGLRCVASIKTFSDKSGIHIATLIVSYKNVIYFYRLKQL